MPELYKLLCELQAQGEFTISRGEVLGMDKEASDLLLEAQRLIDAARIKVYLRGLQINTQGVEAGGHYGKSIF